MAEPIVEYTVEVGFDAATRKLQEFQKKMGAFETRQTKATRTSQAMMNAHHKEREKYLNKEYANKIRKEKELSNAHIAAIKQNMKFDKQAGVMPKGTKASDAHVKARQKVLDDEARQVIKREKELSAAHVAAIKQNIRVDKKAAAERAKAGLPPKIFDNNAHVKAREAELNRQARMEQRRVTNLSTAKETFQRSGLNLRGATNANEIAAQGALKEAVAKATTAREVRLLVAMERERLRVMKQSERSMNKQNFLMQRMTASSKQFAGNMFSAFAAAGLAAGITKVGQDFESVNNTMLAVSTNAQEAGSNFKFVRDEAYRLGLGLAESGKNFAKMLSARGKMSLEDTKKAFSGVAEMSTLLGLSAEESTRAKVCGSFNSNINVKPF